MQRGFKNIALRRELLVVRFDDNHAGPPVESVQLGGFVGDPVLQAGRRLEEPEDETGVCGFE